MLSKYDTHWNPVQQYNLFESGATYTHENQTSLCMFFAEYYHITNYKSCFINYIAPLVILNNIGIKIQIHMLYNTICHIAVIIMQIKQ